MKKQLTLALGLAVISGSALASEARLQALGQKTNGSQYLMDARNIFMNPAQANYFKDMVSLEAGDTTNTSDDTASPNAEGVVLRASGNMVYGVAFGHENDNIQAIRAAAPGTLPGDVNMWDFFAAGDAGVQWGANLSYGTSVDETGTNDIEASSLRANLGIISGDTEAFLRTTLSETAEEDGVADVNFNSFYDLGVSHNIAGGTIFARVLSIEVEEKEGANSEDWKRQDLTLGWGKVTKLNDSASFNYDVSYNTSESEGINFADGEKKSMNVAATMGVEVMVKEWLTLRGSVSQNIIAEEEDVNEKKSSGKDSTSVAAGASLVFGDFQIDGMIGNTDGTTTGENTAAGNGTLRTDSLLSRVSATYRF